ncbi:MAG: hypothetical protein IE886_07900 [Campylobacterales bacterium]|nr:hypothetical protein [Campylobacterales bacterium]
MTPDLLLVFWAVYLLIIVGIVYYAQYRLYVRFGRDARAIAAFYALFCIVLPIIGVPLALLLIHYQQHVSYDSPLPQMKSIHLEPFFDTFPVIKHTFGEASLSASMNDKQIPASKRLVALTTLSEKADKQSIGLFRQMLSNQNDELRLFSFSVIESVEHSLYQQIHKAQNIIENGTLSKALRCLNAKKLAYLYWELVYLELADEVLTRFLLDESERYCRRGLEHNPQDIDLYLLIGKIALRRGDDSAAERALTNATALDLANDMNNTRFLQPYLAEIHYRQRRFDYVKAVISGSTYFRLHATTDPVYRMWRA